MVRIIIRTCIPLHLSSRPPHQEHDRPLIAELCRPDGTGLPCCGLPIQRLHKCSMLPHFGAPLACTGSQRREGEQPDGSQPPSLCCCGRPGGRPAGGPACTPVSGELPDGGAGRPPRPPRHKRGGWREAGGVVGQRGLHRRFTLRGQPRPLLRRLRCSPAPTPLPAPAPSPAPCPLLLSRDFTPIPSALRASGTEIYDYSLGNSSGRAEGWGLRCFGAALSLCGTLQLCARSTADGHRALAFDHTVACRRGGRAVAL